MTTTTSLRKILDRKQFEMISPTPIASAAGMFVSSTPPNFYRQMALFNSSSTTPYLYDAQEDAYLQLPSPALSGMATGSCGCFHPYGPTFTASAGSTTSVTSTLTIPGDLTGATMRCTAGAGAGQNVVITSNTTGANAVMNFAAVGSAFNNTSQFQLYTGRFYVLGASGAAWIMKAFDLATWTWGSALTTTSGPSQTAAADQVMLATSSFCTASSSLNPSYFVSSTSSGSNSSTTLNDTTQTWTASQFVNFQVRITGGTGAGQVKTISANTSTQLTVSAWTTTPDATSTYVIEGADDSIYVLGNAVVTIFKYSIGGNSWSSPSPTTARAAAPGSGVSGNWISTSPNVANFQTPAIANNMNGRRIYSFRGGATATLDYYDIAANTWVNGVSYGGGATATFNAGTSYTEWQGLIYIFDGNSSFYRYDVGGNLMYPLAKLIYQQGAVIVGAKLWMHGYYDSGTQKILWLYLLSSSLSTTFRLMLI